MTTIKLNELISGIFNYFEVFDKCICISVFLSAIAMVCTIFFLVILPGKTSKTVRFLELLGAIFFIYCIYLLQKHNMQYTAIGLGIGLFTSMVMYPEFKDQITLLAEYFGIRFGTFGKSIRKEIGKGAEEKIQDFPPPSK